MVNTYNYLLSYRIKPSQQRIAIMEYLLKHRIHPSVEEVYSALSPSMPTLSKTTVYNTLKLFTEQGAAQMLTIDEKNVCFDGDVSLHAHFLCKKCGTVYDLPMQNALKEVMGMDMEGHAITEVHQYYKGICKNCLGKEISTN